MSKSSLASLTRFAAALFLTSFKAAAAQRRAFVLQALFMAINNLVYFTFWWLLFQRVRSIRGFLLGDVAALFGVSAAGFGLAVTVGGGLFRLGRMIDDGELDPLLTQPKPTLLYALGIRSQASGLGDLVSGIGLLLASGVVPWTRAPLVLVAVTASALTVLASGIIFYSLSFWLKKSEALSRQLFEFLITFSVYPEPLFGGALRVVLYTLIPAGLTSYVPLAALRQPSLATLAVLLAAPPAYLGLAAWVFRRGLRRYSSGSRFGVFA
jgi:ABC-2 type transport system permease protein